MKRFILLITVLAFMPAAAFANKECYSPDELQAEQLLRLHSELMVISYACKYSSQNVNLISVYTAFTQNNLVALQEAEKIVLHHYKSEYGGNGLAHLDDLHTKLGNQTGQLIADQSLEVFCDSNRDRPVKMFFSSPETLNDEVARMVKSAKGGYAMCKVLAKAH